MGIQRIGILTSGGDAPGMNAAIRAATRTALGRHIEVIGIKEGYRGLALHKGPIGEQFVYGSTANPNTYMFRMTAGSVRDIIHRGGTILRSARLPEFAEKENIRQQAYRTLREAGCDALLVLGGDGSYRGADCFRREGGFPVAAVPCTIDNDMPYSDVTIGFDTAVNTAVHSINNLRDTMGSHDRVAIIEVMGRHCGDIAVYAGIAAGAEAILVPELGRTEDEWMEHIIKKLKFSQGRGKRYGIIVMAEGVRRDNNLTFSKLAEHMQKALECLDGGACGATQRAELQEAMAKASLGEFTPESIAAELKARIDADARGMTLAHIQRGGSPTASDRILASRLASRAVELLAIGEPDCAMGLCNGEIIHKKIQDALAVPRKIDMDLIELGDSMAM